MVALDIFGLVARRDEAQVSGARHATCRIASYGPEGAAVSTLGAGAIVRNHGIRRRTKVLGILAKLFKAFVVDKMVASKMCNIITSNLPSICVAVWLVLVW
jgi:hypothetical protein